MTDSKLPPGYIPLTSHSLNGSSHGKPNHQKSRGDGGRNGDSRGGGGERYSRNGQGGGQNRRSASGGGNGRSFDRDRDRDRDRDNRPPRRGKSGSDRGNDRPDRPNVREVDGNKGRPSDTD